VAYEPNEVRSIFAQPEGTVVQPTRSGTVSIVDTQIVRRPWTVEYKGRGSKCSAKNDTCEGHRAKGTEFCIGCLRSKQKAETGSGYIPAEAGE
jgi:hypothetical protein